MRIEYTPEFKRNLRHLAKKYRRIRDDIDPVIQRLAAGEFVGDQIPGVQYTVFKVRIRNQDGARGKSGGYRLIYCVSSSRTIVLVTIYSKFEQGDISAAQIRNLLRESE